MFLEVVIDAGNVGGHFLSIGQLHPAHLAVGRVRLLWADHVYPDTDSSLLRTTLQGWSLALLLLLPATLLNELTYRGHVSLSF